MQLDSDYNGFDNKKAISFVYKETILNIISYSFKLYKYLPYIDLITTVNDFFFFTTGA